MGSTHCELFLCEHSVSFALCKIVGFLRKRTVIELASDNIVLKEERPQDKRRERKSGQSFASTKTCRDMNARIGFQFLNKGDKTTRAKTRIFDISFFFTVPLFNLIHK